ncbi:hypothetical protein, partial [Sporolactobacillus spathodeae]|uniref:hypothetical protein n=1 Tax=Sporolactobacillus spathodeae TaxID=1465502 RepID=UPI0039EC59B0
ARRQREEQDRGDPAGNCLFEEAPVLPAASEQPKRIGYKKNRSKPNFSKTCTETESIYHFF